MIQEFEQFRNIQNKQIYKESHGLSILGALGCELLEDLNMLTKDNLNKIVSNEFLQFVIIAIKQKEKTIKQLTINLLKCYLSYVYFQNQRDICIDAFKNVISLTMVKDFLEGRYDQNFLQYDEVNEYRDTENVLGINSLSEEKQYQEGNYSIKNDLLNGQRVEQIDNIENHSEEMKQLYFQSLKQLNFNDPISQINGLQQSNKRIKFEERYTICYLKLPQLGIPSVYSSVKPTKKEAKSNAAQQLLPHLLFFDKYGYPFIKSDEEYNLQTLQQEEEKEQTEEIKEIENNEFKAKFIQDLIIYSNYQDEVNAVHEMLQQQIGQEINTALQSDYSQKNGLFICTVKYFHHGEERFKTEGMGPQKSTAKEIAYMKLEPQLKQHFYEENGSYSYEFRQREKLVNQEDEGEKPKKQYRRRQRNDEGDGDKN